MNARSRLAAPALLLLGASGALAYNEAVHSYLTGKAFAARGAWLAESLAPPGPPDLDGLRGLFWRTAAQTPDATLRAGFLALFPTEASFDSYAFKQFAMLDPAATVHGFDPVPADEAHPLSRLQLLEASSRWPDDDGRNRHRYQRDAQHQIIPGPDGEPLPYDPTTLDFGSLSGTSSQGHAHYGLVRGPLSDDTEVLKKDPRRFAIPPTAHAWGAEFAQLYTDLALLAQGSELPAREWLTETFAGAAFHHMEDVSNQIHTVQVGIFEFFQAAFIQSKLRDLRTLGGLLGARRSLRTLGVRLVANHHLLSEDLFAHRVAEAQAGKPVQAEVTVALQGLGTDDAELVGPARAAMAQSGGQFARALTDAIIEQSSLEGPEVYRLTWTFSAPTLRDGAGHEYDGAQDDPDAFIDARPPEAQKALARFYQLEGRGLHRATTALRLWQEEFDRAAQAPEARAQAVQRILALLIPYQRDAAARRAAWTPAPPERTGISWPWPLGALAALALLAYAGVRLRKRWVYG